MTLQRIAIAGFVALLLGGCSSNPRNVPEVSDDEEMAAATGGFEATDALYVDPATTTAKREEFRSLLKASGRTSKGKREFYDAWIDPIGANGVLMEIETLWPKCHSEAHELGQAIQSRIKDVGLSLRVCRDGCYSGCMHGVLMEAFSGARDSAAGDHVDVEKVTEIMDAICEDEPVMARSYSPGDCAHGVGHALDVLVEDDIEHALKLCDEFDLPAMRYYCATGAYMQYVTENDKEDHESGKPIVYPCDRYDYPAACARYKMVHVIARHYRNKGSLKGLWKECYALENPHRLGCIHGLGNAHMGIVRLGQATLSAVCLHGTEDEKRVCIEGVMERMAKYHPERAQEVCDALSGKEQKLYRRMCEQSLDQGMYNMEKDLSLYLQTKN